MENKNLNPRESIELISRMIDIRKTNWNDSGHILRMWGWLILAASIAHFILLEFEFYRIFWTPWLITIAGAVYTLIFFTRLGKKQGKSGFLDKLSGFLWWLFAINAFALGFGFTFFFGHMGTGIILIMLGFASALDGKIMQFRPMITGGLITNVLGLFTLGWMLLVYKEVVTEQNFLILLVGVGITLTNIIPGYIMKSEFKKRTR